MFKKQTYLKDTVIDDTQPNQKALQWLRTQFYEKKWEMQENKEKNIQKATNGEPVIVMNYLNYSHRCIRTMVKEVLAKNDFGDDSSIFVVVPSVNDDAEKSSHGLNSTICIQMSMNPLKWKHKAHEQVVTTQFHNYNTNKTKSVKIYEAAKKRAAANQGVKISSKGKKFFMKELPVEELPSYNKETSSVVKDCVKKRTKNKLCQCTTPDGMVQRLDPSCNVITDTTADRPCCCSLKTIHYSDHSPNVDHVAGAMSKLFSPHLAKHGVTGDKSHIPVLVKNAQESEEPVTAPQALCHILPWRHHRAQYHRALDHYDSNNAPQHDNPYLTPHPEKRLNELHHCTVPAQYHINPTPQYVSSYLAPRPEKPCPDLHNATAPVQFNTNPSQQIFNPCLAPRPNKPYPDLKHDTAPAQYHIHSTSQLVNPCFAPHSNKQCCNTPHTPLSSGTHPTKPLAESHHAPPGPVQETTNPSQIQTCQCTPEMMLELLKLAVKGGTIEDMQSIGCGKCGKPPCQKPSTIALSNEPEKLKENDDRCPCGRPSAGMQTDMGEPKQKQVSIKETRDSSSVGTSTEPKTPWYKPKWNETICECPKDKPEPEPEPELDDLDLEFYFQQQESFEETMKKKSLLTERVSGFKFNQKKRQPEPECTVEDVLRYYAMMDPKLFQSINAEQQAKIGGKRIVTRPSAEETEVKEAPAVEEEGPFKGLKFQIGGKGSGTKGLAGICCFDLLQESFTTW